MPRYLTPAKICLLLLVDLYISDEIPASSKLDVLSFIASQTVPPPDNDEQALESRLKFPTSDISIFAEKLSQWQSGVPGRSVHDVLLQRIWKLEDLDSLHGLFEQMNNVVVPPDLEAQEPVVPRVSRSSPLGQYIRRCVLEFTRLQFADTQSLWNAFVTYRAPSFQAWAARNPDAAKTQADEQPSWAGAALSPPTASGFTSTEDTSTLLNFSISQLQKLGARVPDPVKATLSRWLSHLSNSDSADESLQHFLQFFEHWRSGQYTMADESLRRYFDYCIARNSSAGAGGQDNVRVYYQYALLHLSVLHADFERWSESVAAMEECIATARENQDTACLNFALSWLMYLRQAHPDSEATDFGKLSKIVGGDGNGEDDEIAFLRRKAIEGRHWSLLSSTLLEEAKREMHINGSSVKAFQHILDAQHKDVQHDLWTLMPASTLFHASSLDRLGQCDLSNQLYASVNILHSQHCPLNDRIRSGCRLAYNLTQSGQYNDATNLLDLAESEAKGVLKLQQRVQAFKALVALKKNTRKCDLEAATHNLEYLTPMRDFGDPEIQFEISLLEIEFLIKKREYPAALMRTNKQIEEAKPQNYNKGADIAQRLHLMVLKAKIFALAYDGQGLKGFSIAIRAAASAHRLGLVSVMTEAIGVVGSVLNTLEEYGAAWAVIRAVLPVALENRDSSVRADLFHHLTMACEGIASDCDSADESYYKDYMEAAIDYTRRSFDAFADIDDTAGMSGSLLVEGCLARISGDEDTAVDADNEYANLQAGLKAMRKQRKEKAGS